MTIDEWKAQASPEAVEQFEKPVDWFKRNVKCCYNCSYWNKDASLMGDYAYNECTYRWDDDRFTNAEKLSNIKWDGWCKEYSGFAKEDNLLDYAEIKGNYKDENKEVN